MPAAFLCLDPAIVPAGSRQSVGPMSYRRFAEMAVALCFGLTFALVGWWEVAGPIWRVRVDRIRRTAAGRRSATLIGCAILVGGVGALFGAHEMLHRE